MIDVNTNKLREAGNDIISLTNEINEIYNDIFSLIGDMPTKTGEWQGSSAVGFTMAAKIDKANYVMLNNDVKKYGNYLINYANKLDSKISRVRRDG